MLAAFCVQPRAPVCRIYGYAGDHDMSNDAVAGVLNFSQPGAGLLPVWPPHISMTFPNAHGLGRGRRAETDQKQPADAAGPRPGSEPGADSLQPGATSPTGE